ncbi:hypothetical protein DFH28DRAFT_923008 [Melampsora americana]|nr:hypothetical protein DFH28DRAFT_923008 [Melampsora americana]
MTVRKEIHFLPGIVSDEVLALKKVSGIDSPSDNCHKEIFGKLDNPTYGTRAGDIERHGILGEIIECGPKEPNDQWNDDSVNSEDKYMEQRQIRNNGDDEAVYIDSSISSPNRRDAGDEGFSSSHVADTFIPKKFEEQSKVTKRKIKQLKKTKALPRLNIGSRVDNSEAKDGDLEEMLHSKSGEGFTITQDFQSIVSKKLSEILCEHDNTNYLEIHLELEDYNDVFTQMSKQKGHHILDIWVKKNREMRKLLEYDEILRRSKTLWRFIDQEDLIAEWKLTKEKLGKATHKVAKLFKIDERWPVFYDTAPGKWELVKSRRAALNSRQRKSLDTLIDVDEQEKRLATMYVMEKANKDGFEKLYKEFELQHMMRQGVSIPLLFHAIDLLDLNKSRKSFNWKQMPYDEFSHKAMELLKVMWGVVVLPSGSYQSYERKWLASPMRHVILEDSRLSLHFQARLKFLVNNTHHILIPTEKVELEEEIPNEFDGILTVGEALAASHFGISLRKLAWIKHESISQIKAGPISHLKGLAEQDGKILYWPTKLLSKWNEWRSELQPCFQFLGYKVSFEI